MIDTLLQIQVAWPVVESLLPYLIGAAGLSTVLGGRYSTPTYSMPRYGNRRTETTNPNIAVSDNTNVARPEVIPTRRVRGGYALLSKKNKGGNHGNSGNKGAAPQAGALTTPQTGTTPPLGTQQGQLGQQSQLGLQQSGNQLSSNLQGLQSGQSTSSQLTTQLTGLQPGQLKTTQDSDKTPLKERIGDVTGKRVRWPWLIGTGAAGYILNELRHGNIQIKSDDEVFEERMKKYNESQGLTQSTSQTELTQSTPQVDPQKAFENVIRELLGGLNTDSI